MKFRSFRFRLFSCFLVVAAVGLLFPMLYIRPMLHEALLQEAYNRLGQEALLVEALLHTQDGENNALEAVVRTHIRLTLLDATGAVLADSDTKNTRETDNHADRPEVIQAVKQGQGFATRFSNTLQTELVYAAFLQKDDTIVRLATPFAGVSQQVEGQLQGLSLAAGGIVALSLLLAWVFSARLERSLSGMVRIVEGISQGKFSRRLHKVPGQEFMPLAHAVNRMAQSLEEFVQAEADQTAQLNAILETMAEGVLVLGPAGGIRRMNGAFSHLFPAAKRYEGKQIIEAVPCPELQEAVSALLATAGNYGTSQTVQVRAHNGTVFMVLLARPAQQAAASLGLVAVFHDVTELKRLETMRRDFVANVSHELRTPLTALQGYAETLRDMDNMPEDGKRFATIIHKHSTVISSMVNELLALSRLEAETFAPVQEAIAPQEALDAALNMLQAPMQEKDVQVVATFSPGIQVQADRQLVEQIFRNLLENACRYTPQGSTITVAGQASGNHALFMVADNGPGIPPADQPRIFERFYRVEKHRGGGSGLGLAICKHSVERLHGRIWVESPSQNAATAFFFTLPLAGRADI